MLTVIDANVLIAFGSSKTSQATQSRIRGLITETATQRMRLIVPGPALSEFAAKATQQELDLVLGKRIFQIAPFDGRAALECGSILRSWIDSFSASQKNEDRKAGLTPHRFKAKFDHQILAIAIVANAECIVSSDVQLRKLAIARGLSALDINELPIPDAERQQWLDLPEGGSK